MDGIAHCVEATPSDVAMVFVVVLATKFDNKSVAQNVIHSSFHESPTFSELPMLNIKSKNISSARFNDLKRNGQQ